MKERFQDILDIEDVRGVFYLNLEGKVVFSAFKRQEPEKLKQLNWLVFLKTLDHVRGAELVYENRRLYIRKTADGYIFVVMGEFALMEMVRLNCDIVLPAFEQPEKKKPTGLRRFFNI